MKDAELVELAGRQFSRVARWQLLQIGFTDNAIEHRVAMGRLVPRESGVLAVAPVREDDDWARWIEATLTSPQTRLSHGHAAAAWGLWSPPPGPTTVTRPGSGGSRLYGRVLVHFSTTLEEEDATVRGIPITTVPRTLLDLTVSASDRSLARALREAVRLKLTTIPELGDSLARHRGRRGVRRIAAAIARYSGLPLERARSGAEIRAMEILREAGRPLPRLNFRIAGEEADLSWSRSRLIVEIDGAPFHLDAGEDRRKEAIWKAAGWEVLRISADDIYERPRSLIALSHRTYESPLYRQD